MTNLTHLKNARHWSIPLGAVLSALAIHALWGANPVAIKLGIEAFPPLWSGFLRFALGCLCVFAWARYARIAIMPLREEWPAIIGVSALFTLQIALMNIGFGATTAVNSAVLIATNPLFGILFAHFLVPGDRVSPARAIGVTVAFGGAALVLTHGAEQEAGLWGASAGDWIVLASACLLGLRLALAGRILRRVNEVCLTFWQMLLSMPLFAAAGFAWEEIQWEKIGVVPVAAILYQGIVVAGLAFTVNFYLIRRYSPSVMISFNFVSPVAGVLLGMAILGESLTAGLLGGMALVAAGLVLIARR